jgi:molybdopterin biosynthesis enzyme
VLHARTAHPLISVSHLCHFHRVRLERSAGVDLPTAHLTGHQGSGLVHSVGPADAFAVVPEGRDRIEPGETVEVVQLGEGPGAATPGFVAQVS